MGDLVKYRLDNGEEVYLEYAESESDSHTQADLSVTEKGEPGRFTEALKTVRPAVEQLIDQLKELSHQPDEIELGFGVKFSGSSDVIITSTKSNSHFIVRMKWKYRDPSLLSLAENGVLSLRRLRDSAPPAAWALAMLLLLLLVQYSNAPFSIEFYYLAIPIAAWFGYKFGRGGFNVFAVALSVFCFYRSPDVAGFTISFFADLFLFSLGVAWLSAHRDAWIGQMRRIEVSPITLLAGLLFGSVSFGFAGPLGALLFPSFGLSLVAGMLAVVVGFNARHLSPYVYITLVCLLIGAALSLLEIGRYDRDLGKGIHYIGKFFFDGLNEFALIMLCLGIGRMLQRVFLQSGRVGFESSVSTGLLLTLLWFFALHHVVITQGHGVTPAGSPLILLAVSFIVAITWPGNKGLMIFAALMAVAIVESSMASLGMHGIAYDLTESTQLRLGWSSRLESEFDLYLSCIVYFYFGRRISSLATPGADGTESSNFNASGHTGHGKAV